MKRKYFYLIILFLGLIICFFLFDHGLAVLRQLHGHKQLTIVLDAGHGGFDPGKVGINKALEKDINLSIAKKVKVLLEQNDIKVIMTREDDSCLCKKTDQDMKRADLRNRVRIINSSGASFAVSIHQNSYTKECWGAQVFYYQNSVEGKVLAETIQETMKKALNNGNHRLAKANRTYYMLKNTNCPLVIVECGFLSNWTEAQLLLQEDYQDKLAWSILLGIMEYINNSGSTEPAA